MTTGTEVVPIASGQVTVCWRPSRQARRISMRIDPRSGQVVITLPRGARRADGLALLRAHSAWVAAGLSRLPPPVALGHGGHVVLDGQRHEIRHCPDARRGAWLEDGVLHVSGTEEFVPRRVSAYLRAQAQARLPARLRAQAESCGLKPTQVRLRDTKSRWGSCSSDGSIMLCWRLVMAPLEVQHYIIAHELAHLRHMNHGPDFWLLVDSLTPHRRQAEKWLHDHGASLHRIAPV
ncbi:M48 family metallopeptidase [Komagataeibacter swingsii]|uniref:Zinc metallopeptidase n=1 Tax=Komagataeibacter swingsii TaxID=215220 RepID=A0A2V4R955_9PROT|nr:SprT family zinc-dependent metalloprotease [Komagataeibacter swingsii]PYD68680.1 zinc metallopeptidase [Komagataeibacter swingsii]